jgi:acyl-CoA synthetase (AMP-forming)/AMP-acid ligase II
MRLHELFEYHVRTVPARTCIIDGDRQLTYGSMGREVDRLVNALRGAGLAVGDRFGYLSRNSADMVVAYLAASKSGTVALPLNWRLAPVEWQRILEQAEVKAIIAQAEFAAAFDEARSPLIEAAYIVDGTRQAWRDYRAWVASQADSAEATVGDDSLALYQMYTSGTTGEPKGAVLTHRSVLANALQGSLVFEPRFSAQDRALIVMPMFHAGATSFAIGTLIAGATMVIHREFNVRALVDALSGGITRVNLVPAMLKSVLTEIPDVATRDYSRLQTIIYGASPIDEGTLRKALEVFRCRFYQGYGQTEASAVLTFLDHADHERALAGEPELLLSAGRAVAGTQIRIVDGRGRELPAGEIGEIVARGPQLMQEYWKMPAATAATVEDGWLHTGDAGRLDGEGYLYICDRIKDLIISGGENIYPREIEDVLVRHPAVLEAAVIGIPHEAYGETLMAVVAIRHGVSVAADDLVDFCAGQLGRYKIPRKIEFVEKLPRNASGKVLKKELRAPYWRGRARAVG